MKQIIGRKSEQTFLESAWQSKDAVFIAIYGRRRVGKTYLVREYFQNKSVYVEITGSKDGKMNDQLQNFIDGFANTFHKGLPLATPKSWRAAFQLLTKTIKQLPKTKKVTVFLDELPWLATKRSRLLQNLDYFWNTEWSKLKNLRLIVCGSAASWLLDNLINAKGGLHNRISHTLLLKPLDLEQTRVFLSAAGCKFHAKQILNIYMAMGGIPHYLKQIKKSKSVVQNINDICFRSDGLLFQEFPKLFASLFDESEQHLAIIAALGSKQQGLSANNIATIAKLNYGGRLTKRLSELEAAGFIQKYVPYKKKVREHYYRIIDEYTWFYLRWIQAVVNNPLQQAVSNYWHKAAQTQAYKTWAGYAFENVCYKHVDKIAKALDIDSIHFQVSSWRHLPQKGSKDKGAQIDLLFDRDDGVITLCEIKYSGQQITVDKALAQNLKNKILRFEKHNKTNKQINLALITTHGIKTSIWSEGIVDFKLNFLELLNLR